MKIRVIITLVLLGMIVLVAGYHLTRGDLEAVASVPVKAPLSVQATTVEEVEARGLQPATDQTTVFENNIFDYHIVYPLGWDVVNVAPNRLAFRSPDGLTEVTVETAGPLPADGLTAFVNRSLGRNIVISRQALTVHDLPAERVIAHSDKVGGQVTMFFIDAGQSAYVVSGVGDQKVIEMIARSFNAPLTVAQR